MSYCILTEKAFPVILQDGTTEFVGLRDLFSNAHKYKDIGGDNPLEHYSLLRLLIAFSMDMIPLKDTYDRADLYNAGKFDNTLFDRYCNECEKDGPRFDLFDERHPFMQSAYDENIDSKAYKPVANLFLAVPSGNNHIFIDHRSSVDHEATPDKALRAMLACYVFAVAWGQGYPSSVNNTPPVYATVMGTNLFQTIVLNSLSEAEFGNIPFGHGKVPWRSKSNVEPKKKYSTICSLEGFTWMPRRITLTCDDDGLVRRIYLQQGHNFSGNDLWNDPHVPQRKGKDGQFINVKPERGKAFWRDIGTILYDVNNLKIRQPAVIRSLPEILDSDNLPEIIPISMIGMAISNNASLLCWQTAELSIPEILIENQGMADLFRDDVQMIEDIQSMICAHADKIFKSDKKKKSICEVASQLQSAFLQESHIALFSEVFESLKQNKSPSEHIAKVGELLRTIISKIIKTILRQTGYSLQQMQKQLALEQRIWSGYTKILNERVKTYE